MILRVGRFIEIEELVPSRVVCWQYSTSLTPPRRAFPAQDLDPLMRGMRTASLDVGNGMVNVPPLELKLYTLDNGLFSVGYHMDGAVLTEDGRPIHQTAAFRDQNVWGAMQDRQIDLPEPTELDEVFVGFDGAWRNYFHWLCFGIPKSFLAAQHLDDSVVIAVPDYIGALEQGAISYSEATWRQSLAFSGLDGRVTPLAKGIYRARKLHFLWTTPRRPTDIMYCAGFADAFDAMARRAPKPEKPVDDVYLMRSAAVASRLKTDTGAMLARVLEQRGFKTVQAEGCDLAEQIAIFANAKRVVAAHGAGLANTLFHRGGLQVLELNSDLDGNQVFRPWFYVTAAIRKHRYAMLDSTMSGFAAEHVEAALAALDR
jgi:hypothetical protein